MRFITLITTLLLFGSILPLSQAGQGCCSQKYKDCDATYCGTNQNRCNKCSTPGVTWLPSGALPNTCLERWADCTSNKTGCCNGLRCRPPSGGSYHQCLADADSPSFNAANYPVNTAGTASSGSSSGSSSNGNSQSGSSLKAEGETCQVEYKQNGNSAARYTPISGQTCGTGLVCDVSENDDGEKSTITGQCDLDSYAGVQDPDSDDVINTGTVRVTICHRTCSEKNPWVRITIDNNAWNGTNAHGTNPQKEAHNNHEVDVECRNKATGPGDAWGVHRQDYLLKWHGNKQQLNSQWTNGYQKQYWKYWERACPYARAIKQGNTCCSWDSNNEWGMPTCCGANPNTVSPTKPPTKSPTKSPVAPPTKSPVTPPTKSPVAPPTTPSPVTPPTTPSPVAPTPPGAYQCVLPSGTSQFAVITKGDATVEAHNVYTGVAVGGTFKKFSSSSSVVDGKSYVGTNAASAVNWNGGIETGTQLSNVIDFSHFEWLARNAKNSNINGYKVVVKTSGGTFNTYDFRSGGQGEDNGKTLVIFNTADEVVLTSTNDSRQFGPSVIAPFSVVKLRGEAGFLDGFVVAKEFDSNVGSNPSQLQIHGDTYQGSITCVSAPAPTPSPVVPSPRCVETSTIDDNYCPTPIQLVSLVSGPTPPDGMIEVVSFDGTAAAPMVTFKLSNEFQGSVDYFYVEYKEQVVGNAYDTVCPQVPISPACGNELATFTALCHRGAHPFTLVHVWAVNQVDNGGQSVYDNIPECCVESGFPTNPPAVEYTFEIACDCPPTTAARMLRGI